MKRCATAENDDKKKNDVVELPIKDVQTFVTCPICSGIKIDATCIVHCMHSFCRSCIVSHLKSCNQCPICPINVGSNEEISLKDDYILQNVIDMMQRNILDVEIKRRRTFNEVIRKKKSLGSIYMLVKTNVTLNLMTHSLKKSLKSNKKENVPIYQQWKRFECPTNMATTSLQKFLRLKCPPIIHDDLLQAFHDENDIVEKKKLMMKENLATDEKLFNLILVAQVFDDENMNEMKKKMRIDGKRMMLNDIVDYFQVYSNNIIGSETTPLLIEATYVFNLSQLRVESLAELIRLNRLKQDEQMKERDLNFSTNESEITTTNTTPITSSVSPISSTLSSPSISNIPSPTNHSKIQKEKETIEPKKNIKENLISSSSSIVNLSKKSTTDKTKSDNRRKFNLKVCEENEIKQNKMTMEMNKCEEMTIGHQNLLSSEAAINYLMKILRPIDRRREDEIISSDQNNSKQTNSTQHSNGTHSVQLLLDGLSSTKLKQLFDASKTTSSDIIHHNLNRTELDENITENQKHEELMREQERNGIEINRQLQQKFKQESKISQSNNGNNNDMMNMCSNEKNVVRRNENNINISNSIISDQMLSILMNRKSNESINHSTNNSTSSSSTTTMTAAAALLNENCENVLSQSNTQLNSIHQHKDRITDNLIPSTNNVNCNNQQNMLSLFIQTFIQSNQLTNHTMGPITHQQQQQQLQQQQERFIQQGKSNEVFPFQQMLQHHNRQQFTNRQKNNNESIASSLPSNALSLLNQFSQSIPLSEMDNSSTSKDQKEKAKISNRQPFKRKPHRK
ncbi:hypothetical protein SNEBB_005226 [Seison nebaliae]|nr:hypothetical protein SNEBB_005226 [Seison nebaliae]